MSNDYAIVIVTYNRLELCRECVQAALGQNVSPSYLVIVNNASTDGTAEYLDEMMKKYSNIRVINEKENVGGAGGFHDGIKHAATLPVDWIVIIDDDAILEKKYVEELLKLQKQFPDCKALAGVVKVNGKIDTFHRKRVMNPGLQMKNVKIEEYEKLYFSCDIASFCGLMIASQMVDIVGLPYKEYFIINDDTEYCLRLREKTTCLVSTTALLNHKTKIIEEVHPRRYNWKDFYEIRNQIWYTRQHGNLFDIVFCIWHVFSHRVFRNWIFGLVAKAGYDWKVEKALTHRAILAGKRPLEDDIMDTDINQLL